MVDINSLSERKHLERSTEFRYAVGNVVANSALSGCLVKLGALPLSK